MRNLPRMSRVLLGAAFLGACAGPAARMVTPPPPPPPPPQPVGTLPPPPPVGTMPPSVPTTNPTPTPRLLAPAHDEYVRAWGGANPAAVGAFFSDDAHGDIGGRPHHGRAAIVDAWVAPNLPVPRDRIVPESFTGGDDRIRETGHMPAGRYVNEWARQADGAWRIVSVTVTPGR